MSLFNQVAETILQRVAAGTCGADHVGHRDAAVLADVVDDLNSQHIVDIEWLGPT